MKKTCSLLFAFILSLGLLTGCGDTGFSGGGTGGDDDTGIKYTVDEAKNKLKALGNTSGFQISLQFVGSDDESDRPVVETATVGYKVDVCWVVGEMAMKKVADGTEMYTPAADGVVNQYTYQNTYGVDIFENNVTTFTSMFYVAYEYNSYLKEVGSTTFLNREATKYTFTGSYQQAFANVEVIIDNETGITLKLAANAQGLDGESAEGSIIVTDFKSGNDVVVPTLNKGTGGGGGGGEETTTLPAAGVYAYDETQVRDPGMYANGYFEIDENGDGKFYDYINYLGEDHYYTGSFVLDESGNIVMTTVFSITEVDGRPTITNSTGGSIFTFYSVGNSSYAITLDGHYIVYKYDEGGEEDLTKYLVNSQKYTNRVSQMYYLSDDANVKFNKVQKQYNTVYLNETLENNYGNFKDTTTFEGNPPTTTMHIYAKVNGQIGYYDLYEYNNSKWSKLDNPIPVERDLLFGDQMASLYSLTFVPFDDLTEPLSADNPYYYCSSFTYSDNEAGISINLSKIRLYFSDGELVRYSYTSNNYIEYDVRLTDFGMVDFDIPKIDGGGEGKEVQNNALLSGESGSKFVYYGVDKGEYTGTAVDASIAALQNYSFNFFTNGDVESIQQTSNILVVIKGTYTLTYKEGENIGNLSLSLQTRYVNGRQDGELEFTPRVDNHLYYLDSDTFHIVLSGTDGQTPFNVHVIFARSDVVPTPYVPEEPPVSKKWPAEDIAKKLASLGFNVTLPAPSIDDAGIKNVTTEISDGTLVIAVLFNAYNSMTAAQNAQSECYTYLSNSDGFSLYASECEFVGDIVMAYLSIDETVLVKVHYVAAEAGIKIVVSSFNKNAYPADKISEYCAANEINVSIPSLEITGVTYEFLSAGGMLYMTPEAEDMTVQDIVDSCGTLLLNGGFKRVASYTDSAFGVFYFDTGLNCLLTFVTTEDQAIMFIEAYDKEEAGNPQIYPKDELDETYPAGVKDSYPSFEIGNATYYVKDCGDNLFTLFITMQADGTAQRAVSSFEATLTREYGYSLVDNKYVSPNGEIEIKFSVIQGMLIQVDIQYIPREEEDVRYTLVCQNDFDMGKDGVQLYAYVWDNKGDGYFVPIYYDEEAEEYYMEVSNYMIGCIILRFEYESEIDWEYGEDGTRNEGVHIANRTGDLPLSGESSTIEFRF